MGDAFLLFVAAGVLAAAWLAWAVARRFGLWPGLVIPAVAVGGAVGRSAMPLGHAEEAMGRGIEQMAVWAPLVLVTVLGWVAGVLSRRR